MPARFIIFVLVWPHAIDDREAGDPRIHGYGAYLGLDLAVPLPLGVRDWLSPSSGVTKPWYDTENFTTLCETSPAPEIVALMCTLFDACHALIVKRQGTIMRRLFLWYLELLMPNFHCTVFFFLQWRYHDWNTDVFYWYMYQKEWLFFFERKMPKKTRSQNLKISSQMLNYKVCPHLWNPVTCVGLCLRRQFLVECLGHWSLTIPQVKLSSAFRLDQARNLQERWVSVYALSKTFFKGRQIFFFFLLKKRSLKTFPGIGLIPNSARWWFLIWLKIAKLGLSDA